MPAAVTIYTTSVCPYCFAAKRLLKTRGVAYDEIDVSNDPGKRAWLVEATGRRTVPQIFIGSEAIGGYDDLSALDAAGALQAKLDAAGAARG
jgi:glutaredoxin 3